MCIFDKKERIIKKKIKRIEKETGNKITIEEVTHMSSDALIDFDNWTNMEELPKILHKPSIDRVHIIHELIHLETFFIEGYQIIAHYNNATSEQIEVEKKFKNLPEDHVAHNIINDYGLNPIKESFFQDNENINVDDEVELAVRLVKFYTFANFRSESYKERADNLLNRARTSRPVAFQMAERAIDILNSIDYKNKDSYNALLPSIIEIFASRHSSIIHPSSLIKENNRWRYSP